MPCLAAWVDAKIFILGELRGVDVDGGDDHVASLPASSSGSGDDEHRPPSAADGGRLASEDPKGAHWRIPSPPSSSYERDVAIVEVALQQQRIQE